MTEFVPDTGEACLQLNLKDRTHKRLAAFGSRISTLLERECVQRSPHVLGTLDDLLGGIYALVLAKEGGFTDRTNRSIEVSAVERRSNQLARGQVRLPGKWMAGFHFNSALFRLAAVYHRVLLVVVTRPASNERETIPPLRSEAKALYRKWKRADWVHQHADAVHQEVIGLKHRPKGVFHGRRAKFEHAVSTVDELLDLLESWTTTQ